VATQLLWGLSWTLAGGADVAWITDELDAPARISVVLLRAGRAELTGAAAGMVGVGALAWVTRRGTAMVLAGTAMLLLGLYVVAAFPERRFVPVTTRRWSSSWSILVRGSRAILVMVAAALLAGGVTSTFGRALPPAAGRPRAVRRSGGMGHGPGNPGPAGGHAGAARGAAPHRRRARPRRGYVVTCGVAAVGVRGLVGAPERTAGSAAVLLAAGALPLTRTIGTIWVNRQTGSDVRAAVRSFLAQALALGAIACGLVIAAVARLAGLPWRW
jgi:hypothetical protein